ncbi:Beta-glucanase [Thalassocella blandensis]|nr:Beta-glucanase [Thalassocella blandensis]
MLNSVRKWVTPLALLTVPFFVVPATYAEESSWELVWADEFNIDGPPDSSKWAFDEAFVANHELQYYTTREANARVRNGALVIEARKEKYKNPLYVPGYKYDPQAKKNYFKAWEYTEYTSARLVTRDIAEWKYGRIEVRAKLPTGRGMWPAIWMLGHDYDGDNWPLVGEIDIMENVGYDPDEVHANIHTESYNHLINTNKGNQITVDKPYEKYHVYAVEWDENKMEFFVDDQKYFSFKNEKTGEKVWPFDKKYYLILNVAVGGVWGGQKGVDDTIFPQRMYVDYARVYQKK